MARDQPETGSTESAGDARGERVRQTRATLERLLLENFLPFWTARVIDRDRGGYRLNHDHTGRDLGPHPRTLIAQSRTLWFFARLARSPYGTAEHRAIAEHGFAFLRDAMHDREHGGCFGEVDADGKVVRDNKHLCEQSFALYACVAYRRLTDDEWALKIANEIVGGIAGAADAAHGGFHETLDRGWHPITEGAYNVIGMLPQTRTVNTHLHLLESLTAYQSLAPCERVAAMVTGLIDLLTNRIPDPRTRIAVDMYHPDWTIDHSKGTQPVSYGHSVETAWLLLEAAQTLGPERQPTEPIIEYTRGVVDWCRRHGFDRGCGGFYFLGPMRWTGLHRLLGRRGLLSRDKVWWVQAEALIACLRLYGLTGDPDLADTYLATLDWIDRFQADHENGGWHAILTRDGVPKPLPKADEWKTPYHDGRALLTCLAML